MSLRLLTQNSGGRQQQQLAQTAINSKTTTLHATTAVATASDLIPYCGAIRHSRKQRGNIERHPQSIMRQYDRRTEKI